MTAFIEGLVVLILIALVLQLLLADEMDRAYLPLVKLAVGLWILRNFFQLVGHRLF